MNAQLLSRGHLSSEAIDLLLLAALSPPEANEAKQHLDGCDDCRVRWQELNADKQRFEQFVFARTLPKVEARVAAERQGFFGRFKFQLLVPILGVAAAFAVVATMGPGTQTEDDVYVGIKGAQPTLEVFAVRGAGGAFPVSSGVTLQPKDKIRFVVNPAGAKYLIVASRDGAGLFSVYHPFGAQQSQPLTGARSKLELPGAVELDATLGAERLVAAFSEEPLMAEQVEAALKADPKNPKLPGVRFVTTEFVKVAP
ncbi:MAG: zf-HC2 domain-containing protein [Archangium sp.]|nr:zf-HC2 domain-containing protein [Archangium sp.]MDP3157040.1 zf-HC2 domain-containing protein [Archangium sp.]MDP3575757.1 zf-HC2 domain-containing protein [Archangium sp.]